MLLDARRAEVHEQLQARVHPCKILEGQRHELVAPRIVAPVEVVPRQLSEIVGSARRHPAHDRRIERAGELPPHVHESRAPWRQQPFLRTT